MQRTSVRTSQLELIAKPSLQEIELTPPELREIVNRRGRKERNCEENMKLSVEAKVAAAVAAGFVALTLGAIAQGNSDNQPGRANSSIENPGVTHMSQQGYDSSLPDRTYAEQDQDQTYE